MSLSDWDSDLTSLSGTDGEDYVPSSKARKSTTSKSKTKAEYKVVFCVIF